MVAGIVYSFHHSVLKRVSFVQEEEKSVKDQRWEKEVLWRAFNDRQMLGDKTSGEKTFLRDVVDVPSMLCTLGIQPGLT